MTLEEFEKKANNFMAKRNSTNTNKNVANNETKSDLQKFEEKANKFLEKRNNATNAIVTNAPQKTTTEKKNSLWVESTASNALGKKNINMDVKPVNISNFVKDIKNSEAGQRASLTMEADNLQKQIQQKEQEYAKSNNISDWNKKTQAKTEIGQELNALKEKLNATKTSIAELNRGNEKLLTAEQVAENNKNAPLSQKIDKAIKYDIPKTAEKLGRTALDLGANVAVGATNAIEGMVDFGVGNAGALASGVTSGFGLAPNSLSEKIKKGAEDFARFNFSGEELLEEKKNEGTGIYEPKILNWKVRDALNVISSMMTSAAIGGMPAFVASAAGQNIEEALLDNQSLNRAVIYGDTAGVVEGLTEKMFDAVKLLGGGKFDKFLPKKAIAKLIGNAGGEAIEEVIADGINPVLKYFTYEKGTYDMPSLVEYLNILKQAAFNGFTLGFIMKGGQDISTPQIREQYKEEIYTAVDKSNLPENVKQTVKEVMITPAQAQINQDLQNLRNQNPQSVNSTIQRENVTGLPKLNVQNQAQTQNIEQTNTTLPNQVEMAQNANMEQIKRNTTINPQLQLLSTNSSALNGSINQNNDNVNEFGKQIDDLLSGKRNRKDSLVVLSNTPKIIQEIGAKDLPITVTSSKLERIMNAEGKQSKQYHDLGIDIVKQLPEALERPLNILKSHDNSYVVVTELADKQDRPIIASIKIDGTGRLNDVEILSNVMTSAYGRNNYDAYMQRNIKEGNLVYDIDEGIIKENLTDGARLQLSRTTNEVSNNSINQNDSSVNTEYAQNNKNDTTYISPVSDIQSATEFVKKATIKDVETLQKMVEEAEKNPDRIDLQFFAEKAREAIDKLSRQQVREAIIEETGLGDYNLDDVNKISKAKMNFTTPVRVIEKIFNKETANKINENFFKPIKHNEAERIRRLNQERNDIKELDVKPGSAEDAAIQKFGEGEYIDESGLTIPYTLENLKQDFPESWQKLQKATNVIRNKYDTYLEEINEVLKDNGYDPIPKRKDYFRHFEELNDLFSILGVPTKVDDIPTDLNGMTADLKPGKQFFANALQRKGNKTTYSAIKGIDGYLDGAMNMLYHTKDIQKLRTLEKYIRDTYGTQKGLDDANAMTDEQKNKRINQINEGHLSEFAAWLMEYTNALAGKKSRLDRGIEEMFGRKAYKYLNLIKKQVGANMTGLNVNSALSNFISVTQAAPKTSKKALVKGTVDTVKNIFNKDGFIDKSDFLTTRFGSDKIAKNWWQKAGDVGQIFMSGTDYFTANLITRSKYQEFLDKGYSDAEAMKKADEFADRLMAGRGKGDLPTAFESKMLGIVTQFQLEVTNQLDSIFYDTMHEDYASQSKSKLAKEHPDFYNTMSATFILGQIFALAFLYNEGKEELTGTDGGAFDPIGTIADAIQYYTDENLSFGEATVKVVEDIANQLPFASIITGGGRLPVKEAFPDLLSVWRGEAKLGDEMWKLTNLLLPTGGGQLKKTTQGLNTFAKGGAYSKDAEGKEKLKYPVEQNLGNFVKSALFGKWSTEGAKRYIDSGFKALSANQTEGYEKAKKAGITDEQFYNAYNAQKKVDELGDLTSIVKKNEIDKATKGISTEKRKILYETFGVAKGEWDNTRIVFPYEIKAQKEKLAREKLKTEKK